MGGTFETRVLSLLLVTVAIVTLATAFGMALGAASPGTIIGLSVVAIVALTVAIVAED